MRTLIPLSFFLSVVPLLAQPAPVDRKGCEDSKVITRLEGCVIALCNASDYNLAEIYVNDPKAPGGASKKKVEGQYEKINFNCARTDSFVGIARKAELALKRGGFNITYQRDGSNWAGVTGKKGAQWVSIMTRNGSYELVTLKEKALETTMKANAEGWAQQIEQTGRVSVYGINFDTAKATIKPDSEPVLAEVLALLQKNPTWRLAVAGHTDNVGAKAMNLTLSKQRAESVAAWLAAKGIEKDRLLPGGFGDTVPTADNATEEGRAQNRRVDLIKLY